MFDFKRLLPQRLPFVRPVCISAPVEEVLLHVEIIPREVADIMRKPFNNISDGCCPVNDALGYETLYNAIIEAESIGASLLGEVIPENLFFIFGQTIESLGYAPIEFPLSPPFFNERVCTCEERNKGERNGHNKDKSNNRAVVLCKLKHPYLLEELFACKEQKPRHNHESYKISWGELQKLKKRLCDFGEHS